MYSREAAIVKAETLIGKNNDATKRDSWKMCDVRLPDVSDSGISCPKGGLTDLERG